MAEVLLTHSNHVYSDVKQAARMQPYPPLQTILAAAVLRANEISAALFDPTLEPPDPGFAAAIQMHQPRLIVVCEDDFNFLSKMCLAHNRDLAFRMAGAAKQAGISIAAHGSDASDHAAEYLAAGFDWVLIGEVEETLLELASGKPAEQIAGLAWNDSGSPRVNKRRALRSDLDSLPAPAWDLVDVDRYREAWTAVHGYFSLNMASSRGCPYHCNWCAKPIYGNSYHARSPQSVAGEMLFLKRTYRPDRIWFADDIFALSPRWSEEFASAVEERNASVPFRMQSRCDLMTRDTVGALRRAGCSEVWMGAESGSQRVLDAMEKGVQADDVFHARENLARYGIRTGLFLQFGYPGETWEDIEATIAMVRRARPDDIGVSVSYPLPGTRFHQIVSSRMSAQSNWKDSADLAMMFRGEYSTEFYRALADALHAEVRGAAAGQSVSTLWRRVRDLREAARLREVA